MGKRRTLQKFGAHLKEHESILQKVITKAFPAGLRKNRKKSCLIVPCFFSL